MNGKVTAWFSLSPFGLQKYCETQEVLSAQPVHRPFHRRGNVSPRNWSDFEVAQLVGTRSTSFNLSGKSSFPALQSSWQPCSEAHPISAALSLKLLGLDTWPQRGPMLSEHKQKIALAFPHSRYPFQCSAAPGVYFWGWPSGLFLTCWNPLSWLTCLRSDFLPQV